MATTKRHDVKDLALAPEGVRRIMPVREVYDLDPHAGTHSSQS